MTMGTSPVSLVLLAGLLWFSDIAEAGCSESQKCCNGRDHRCSSIGWTMNRVYGTCYCDQACRSTGDCCYDYIETCPELKLEDACQDSAEVFTHLHELKEPGKFKVQRADYHCPGPSTNDPDSEFSIRDLASPCVVSEWSQWSGCAEQCQPTVRIRQRHVEQEPLNHGDPCPPLEERAGCLEYMNYQGVHCGQSYGPAFISTAAYNKERRKLAVFEDKEIPGYCTEFTIESLSFHCTVENRSFARWMQYLREGYTVCVTCQPPAMNSHNHRCHGDGANDNGTHVFQWQAVGNSQCRGTWRKVREVAECSCPIVHSFIFT